MSVAQATWFAAALLLLAADVALGRRRLLPYMAALVVTSALVTLGVPPSADLGLRAMPPIAWAIVLRRRTGDRAASRVGLAITVAGAVLAVALPVRGMSVVAQLNALFVPQVGIALATVAAYVPVARAHTARPAPVDVALVSFAALDLAVGLGGLVQLHVADLRLWEFWDALTYLNAGVFVAVAGCYWWRR
ncbi:MAG: hypothetical protein AAF447_16600 [Myxococcota bacterium]